MKNTLLLLMFLTLFLFSTSRSNAKDLFWDSDGSGVGCNGTGNWNTTSLLWSDAPCSGNYTNWPNTTNDTATFPNSGGSGTEFLIMTTPITVNKITNYYSGGILCITNNTITFDGISPWVEHTNTGAKLQFTHQVLGPGVTLTKSGAGRMALENNGNTISKYVVKGGIISTANSNKWGTAVGQDAMTLDGGGWGADSTSQQINSGLGGRGFTLTAAGGSIGMISATLTTTLNCKITGPGSLTFGGGAMSAVGYNAAGFYILTNAAVGNDYQGGTIVTKGTVIAATSEVLPNGTTLTLNGGSLDVQTNTETVGNVIVSSSSSAISGTGTLIASNYDMRASGTIAAVLAGDANLVKTTSGTITLNGAKTYTGHTTNSAGTIALNGTGSFGNGAGVLTLSGGNITLNNSRNLANNIVNNVQMTADATIQNGSTGTGAILFRHGGVWTTTGGTLTIKNTTSTGAGSFDVVLSNSFTFSQPIIIGASGDTLPCQLSSFNTAGSADQIFAAEISGYGTYRRSVSSGNGGRTIFTSDNTYSGGTTINAGTLLVNNPGPGSGTGSGTNTVGSGGVLGGTGIVAGPVVVNSAGAISAGASAGILTLQGGLDLSGGGTNGWELAAQKDDSNGVAGTDFDQLALTTIGELNLSGNSRLLLKFIGSATTPYSTDPFWQSNHSWTIITLAAPATNTLNLAFSNIVNGTYNAGYFSNYVGAGGNIILTFTTNAPSAPIITAQPPNRAVNVGASAAFSLTASGTDPLSYQWYFQNTGNPISGATNISYTRTNVQPADAGNYFANVTNILGSTNTANGALTVILPQPTVQPLSGAGIGAVVVSWNAIVGGAYAVQYNTNLMTTNWITFTNLTATSTSVSVTNFPPAGDPQRFYRVLGQY